MLAPLQTVLNSIANGNYDLRSGELKIQDQDFVGWNRLEYESLTLILLVDISKSTWAFVNVFKEILSSLTGYFNRHNDRVGLIALQGEQARVYNYPTHNFRVVARGLGKLRFHGMTPLADGLYKSLNMAKLERGKNPGSRSVVILLSDCYPEPVTPDYEDVLEAPEYKNAVSIARTYKKSNTMLLVINPTFTSEEGRLPGEVLSKRIVRASGGKLVKLYRPRDTRHDPPSKKEIGKILSGIEEAVAY